MNLYSRRVRGFRLVDLVGLGVLVAIILSVYLVKTIAGRERAEIAKVERLIEEEKLRIRLLKAEVSHLETPDRVKRLSTSYLNMKPVEGDRQTTEDALVDVARSGAPKPPVQVQ
jgi:cell division protein FtsL